MRRSRRTMVFALAVALHAQPDAAGAGAPQPVAVDCNAGTLVLDAPGSYVLTDDAINCNLAPAIQITASNVVLDLGGRTLDGPDQNGTAGIIAPGGKVVIRNGRVQDFGVGIALAGPKGVLDGVDVLSNLNQGIILNDGALVADSRSALNGGSGLEGLAANAIRRSVFRNNGGSGVLLGDRNVLVGNVASGNGASGFALFHENKLLQNVAAFNTQHGFMAGERNLLKGNTATSNGSFGFLTTTLAPTFSEGGGNRVTGNVAVGNGIDGIYVEGRNLVERNRAFANQEVGIWGFRGTFKGNETGGNVTGLIVYEAVAVKNVATGNRTGIAAVGDSAVLTANVATANVGDGILLSPLTDPGATRIVKNVVHGNAEQGIDLPDGAAPVGKGKNSARGNGGSPQCDGDLCRE